MNKDIIEFINKNPICYLATTEDDQPRVRAFMCWMADDTGLYFDTANYKDTFKQLQSNPKMEACFYCPDPRKMLRVSGKVEFTDDEGLRKKLFKEKEDNPQTVIFRLTSGDAVFWSRDENKKSHKEVIEF